MNNVYYIKDYDYLKTITDENKKELKEKRLKNKKRKQNNQKILQKMKASKKIK